MGARISIAFKKGDEKSVTLFSHWGGEGFMQEALDYVELLKVERKGEVSLPLDRLEPGTVMVDFIRHITQGMKRVDSDLYLAKDKNGGDNSDYGHHIIKLDTKE